MAIETKVGAYLCSGCEIGDAIDLEALQKLGSGKLKLPICKVHAQLCNPEGLKMIRDDIAAEGLSRVVIAACSGRVKVDEFRFDNGVMVDRVALREFVAWVMEPKNEDTRMAAEDYLRMSVAKMRNSEPPVPWVEETNKTVLVIGGGVSGMRSALSAAAAGYEVILVEKEDKLGGWAAKFKQVFPKAPPYKEPVTSNVQELIQAVESNPQIKLFKSSTIKKIDGEPGKFDVILKGAGESETLCVGSIVLASGWKPYDATKLTHLGYGKSPNVVTNVQIEE
ncbi:MAG: FAD-dependent oxidoreductase, partial [bacterium]